MKLKIGVFVLAIVLLVSVGFYTGFAVFSSTSLNSTTPVGPVSATFQCNDGIDNDNDTLIDYPSDPGCTSFRDNSEWDNSTNGTCGNGIIEPPEECDDGNLNNGDGCDSNCMLENGTNSTCSDTDGGQNIFVKGIVTYNGNQFTDGCLGFYNGYYRISENWCEGEDYHAAAMDCPVGFICSEGACIDNSTNGTYECNDGIDNDNDTLIDFPADPGCNSSIDDDESDGKSSGPGDDDGRGSGTITGITITKESILVSSDRTTGSLPIKIFDKDNLGDDLIYDGKIGPVNGMKEITFKSLRINLGDWTGLFEGKSLELYAQIGDSQSKVFTVSPN